MLLGGAGSPSAPNGATPRRAESGAPPSTSTGTTTCPTRSPFRTASGAANAALTNRGKRASAKGSGEWTPSSDAKPARADEAQPQEAGGTAAFQLVGVEGEYSGEVLPVPLSLSAEGGTAVLGRSSSCDVTLGRDDQISRKHHSGNNL